MTRISIKKGLDLPITGDPRQEIEAGRVVSRVAIMADDYVGMKPRMQVAVGDVVGRGQVLFEDKKTPGVVFTAPGAGTVTAINRGQRRALQSVVIELSEAERSGQPSDDEVVTFESYTRLDPSGLNRDQIKALLLESGMWTALRARPFGRTARPEDVPHSVFVTAMDSNPLAASVDAVMAGQEDAFKTGLACVAKLTDGPTFVCKSPATNLDVGEASSVEVADFEGPHPAGTVGVHIHFLDPVSRGKTVWYLNYQDVISIGRLMTTGRLDLDRVVALAGPTVKQPRLLRTRMGASLDDLVEGELAEGTNRVISGSVLSGRTAQGEVQGYLGRYHLQVSSLADRADRQFLAWTRPGLNKFSVIPIWLQGLLPKKLYDFTTARNGGPRAIVPIGLYERMMPMDIQPTFLLRSLAARNYEKAEQLGCLELEEEDLALCSFVCPGKSDFGPLLRENLTVIEKEG